MQEQVTKSPIATQLRSFSITADGYFKSRPVTILYMHGNRHKQDTYYAYADGHPLGEMGLEFFLPYIRKEMYSPRVN